MLTDRLCGGVLRYFLLDGNSIEEHAGRVTEITKTGLTDTVGVSIRAILRVVSTVGVSIRAFLTRWACQALCRY